MFLGLGPDRVVPSSIDYSIADNIAIIPVSGILARNTSNFGRLLGMIETQEVINAVQRANEDNRVNGIVLSINSPGGMARGMPEAAEFIRESAKKKPIIAHTSDVMGSAAYYLASQSNEIVASRTAQVGSIGTIISILDTSKQFEREGIKNEVFTDGSPMKAIGLPGVPMTDEMRAVVQENVNSIGADFRADVKTARPFLHASAMRGQLFQGKNAVENGMVDFVGGLDVAINRAKSRGKSGVRK
jgi:signal peptide peptidase SppA